MDVCLLWFPHCERTLYKYRSIFPYGLNCSLNLCLSTGIDIPLLFTYRNSKMGEGPGSWVKNQGAVKQETCPTNIPLCIAINECGSSDKREASWWPTLSNSLFLADCGNFMLVHLKCKCTSETPKGKYIVRKWENTMKLVYRNQLSAGRTETQNQCLWQL